MRVAQAVKFSGNRPDCSNPDFGYLSPTDLRCLWLKPSLQILVQQKNIRMSLGRTDLEKSSETGDVRQRVCEVAVRLLRATRLAAAWAAVRPGLLACESAKERRRGERQRKRERKRGRKRVNSINP